MREEFIKIMQYSSFRQNEPPPPPCPDIIYYIHIYIEYRRELWENWSSPGVLEVMKGKYSNNNIRCISGQEILPCTSGTVATAIFLVRKFPNIIIASFLQLADAIQDLKTARGSQC